MDKQQFDHIDDHVRQAADEITVPFSEEAWKRMEVKLDNEFNKDRRRGIIWWWFSLMLLGISVAGIYLYNYKFSRSENIAVTKSTFTNNKTSLKKNIVSGTRKPKEDHTKAVNLKNAKNTTQRDKRNKTLLIETKNSHISLSLNNQTAKLKKEHVKTTHKPFNSNIVTRSFRRNSLVKVTVPAPEAESNTSVTTIKSNELKGIDERASHLPQNSYSKKLGSTDTSVKEIRSSYDSLSTSISTKNENTSEPVTKNDHLGNPDSVSKKNAQVKLDHVPSKGFYFLASVAGEATGTKDISIKDTKPIYGVGIGYSFNKRLSVQTGFYLGKKVYFASADDYKVKSGSYIAKFISAQAECYIYDIPVTLRYDVLHKKKYNFYFTTGLSSYILKRETYDMHFFSPSGMYHHMTYTYKHHVGYLSVLDFSVGYEHKLSNAFSVQAEPYLKLPLSGLGEGSVKLNSAGFQVGIKYRPLKKKK